MIENVWRCSRRRKNMKNVYGKISLKLQLFRGSWSPDWIFTWQSLCLLQLSDPLEDKLFFGQLHCHFCKMPTWILHHCLGNSGSKTTKSGRWRAKYFQRTLHYKFKLTMFLKVPFWNDPYIPWLPKQTFYSKQLQDKSVEFPNLQCIFAMVCRPFLYKTQQRFYCMKIQT